MIDNIIDVNLFFQISAIIILSLFYAFYIAKIIVLKRQSIKTNQAGVGNKAKRVLNVERIMSAVNILALIADVCSVFVIKKPPILQVRIVGVIIGIFAVIIFALAIITMKNSWRVGIPEEKTSLVTNGIYKWSRNPAFVGFDLLYLSMCLLFFNVPLLVISICAVIMLHIQISQEEEYMKNTFGKYYLDYMEHTLKYFGKR